MTMVDAPTLDVNFADPDLLQDPYPILHAIREAGPAVYNPSIDHWMVASYRHVRAIILDDTRFVPDSERFEELYGAPVMESMENPRHNEVRGIWASPFRINTLEGLRGMITEVAEDRLDPLVEKLLDGEVVDIVPTFSRVIAALVIARMLGVSQEDIPQFVAWSADMGKTLEALNEPEPERASLLQREGHAATAAICTYAGRQLDKGRKGESSGDLIGMLALSPVNETMSEEEQQAAVAQLIVAGHDNMTHTISQTLIALAQHHEQRRAIVHDRSLIPQTIEEVLRWKTSASGDTRVVREQVALDDVTLPESSKVMILLAAANRDPERWEDPDRFDIFRPAKRHLAFGLGTHVCLGLNLARLEAQVMLDKILDRIPSYILVDEHIEYGPPFFMRGPKAARIRL